MGDPTKFFYHGQDPHLDMINEVLVQKMLFIDHKQRKYAKLLNYIRMYSIPHVKLTHR